MTHQEKVDTVWAVYDLYKARNNTQAQIAEKLNISVELVGKITRALGYHNTTIQEQGERVVFRSKEFMELFD